MKTTLPSLPAAARRKLIAAALLLASLTASGRAAPPQVMAAEPDAAATAVAPPAADAQREDEQAVRAVADNFAKAYNAKDARAVGALFADNGEIVDDEGHRAQGRPAIEGVFSTLFQANPKTRIEIAIASIHFVAPAVAVEDGTSRVFDETGRAIEHNRYTAVHVKQRGKWQMASARDLPGDVRPASEELAELSWLIGDWVDESPEALILTSYRWAEHHDFILSDFTVQVRGRPAMTGSQRIGWDPQSKKLRSWVFDSEGGFAEGVWTRRGNQWVVKLTGVTREGKTASATKITTQVSKDRMTWQLRDRVMGEAMLPDGPEYPIVRRPPRPQAAPSRPAPKGDAQ